MVIIRRENGIFYVCYKERERVIFYGGIKREGGRYKERERGILYGGYTERQSVGKSDIFVVIIRRERERYFMVVIGRERKILWLL